MAVQFFSGNIVPYFAKQKIKIEAYELLKKTMVENGWHRWNGGARRLRVADPSRAGFKNPIFN